MRGRAAHFIFNPAGRGVETMQTTSPWHTPSAKRDQNNYNAGRKAYLDGDKYNFHGNAWWQKGYRDARDAAYGVGAGVDCSTDHRADSAR
jgi:hypothetical protein